MLHFSVPLAADIDDHEAPKPTQGGVTVAGADDATLTGMAENEDNDGNGTIMITPGAAGYCQICSSEA